MDGPFGSTAKIKVKFLARPKKYTWLHQFPNNTPIWENCTFSFDPDDPDYDWLVVYDDLPPVKSERRSLREEVLKCDKSKTILVTTEPSSIKSYFSDYTDQFGAVLTSQPSWALRHKNRIYQQPALQWYYGVGSNGAIPFNELERSLREVKSELISVVGSAKQQSHTLHAKRHQFINDIVERCPNIQIYGRDYRPMDDKAEALKQCMFHIAIENEYSPHHWTEKLSDTYIAEAVPIYFGCPNIDEYFPSDSYIRIDIDRPDKAAEIISALSIAEYEKRLPSVLKAKQKVLYEYNLFPVLTRIINRFDSGSTDLLPNTKIESRRRLIRRDHRASIRHLYQKIRLRLIHKFHK